MMSLTLSGREMSALNSLSRDKGMSKSAVLRLALRLYQTLEERSREGKKLFVEDPIRREKAEILLW